MPVNFQLCTEQLFCYWRSQQRPVSIPPFFYSVNGDEYNIKLQQASSTSASFYIYNLAASSVVTGSTAVTLNRFQLLEALDSGTTGTILRTNGVQDAQNTAMNAINNITRSNNYLGTSSSGSGNYFNGEIAEILFYNTAITSSQQAALEAYAAQKYQFASQVPTAPILSLPTSTLTGPAQVAIAANPLAQIKVTRDGFLCPRLHRLIIIPF